MRWYLVSRRYSTVGSTLSLAPRFDMLLFFFFAVGLQRGRRRAPFFFFLPKTLCTTCSSTKFVSSACQSSHLSLATLHVKVYVTRSVKCETEHAGIATCPTGPAQSRSNSLARPFEIFIVFWRRSEPSTHLCTLDVSRSQRVVEAELNGASRPKEPVD